MRIQEVDMGYARVPNGIGEFIIQTPTFLYNNDQFNSVINSSHIDFSKKKLVKITDLLGRDVDINSKNLTLLYIYDDGSIERKQFLK